MVDLESKQKVWSEQLPIFKENYILAHALDLLEFNMTTGQFDVKPQQGNDGFDEEDSLELYHSTNTSWAMWLRCNCLKQTEINLLRSENAALKEKLKKVEGGRFVVVPKEFDPVLAEKIAFKCLPRPTQENDKTWIEIVERAYQDNLKSKKFEIMRTYKELIEAAQGDGDE